MAKRTEPREIRRLQRRLKALELRTEGKTYREIATELGYKNGVKEAHVAVKEALAYIED
jgi:uncharacterized protein YerC